MSTQESRPPEIKLHMGNRHAGDEYTDDDHQLLDIFRENVQLYGLDSKHWIFEGEPEKNGEYQKLKHITNWATYTDKKHGRPLQSLWELVSSNARDFLDNGYQIDHPILIFCERLRHWIELSLDHTNLRIHVEKICQFVENVHGELCRRDQDFDMKDAFGIFLNAALPLLCALQPALQPDTDFQLLSAKDIDPIRYQLKTLEDYTTQIKQWLESEEVKTLRDQKLQPSPDCNGMDCFLATVRYTYSMHTALILFLIPDYYV